MDYVVGSVAALISGGNVTPNRPKLAKRALTPVKHQPSPKVTPKSESVPDRSIFLSPSLQKKKAIVKKSPKRIFDNPGLDTLKDPDSPATSPQAEKVKKHLQADLESEANIESMVKHKGSKHKSKKSLENTLTDDIQVSNKALSITSPKKKQEEIIHESEIASQSESKKKVTDITDNTSESSPKKKKKRDKKKKHNQVEVKSETVTTNEENIPNTDANVSNKKSKKRNKKKQKIQPVVNPNAITEKDTDSEHESDNDIESDNDKEMKEAFDSKDNEPDSSDEEDVKERETKTKSKKKEKVSEHVPTEEETNRTLFVGNVPFCKKTKKRIKKLFGKHGTIDSVRIRAIPVKDARSTPKLAVIKNELHPERSTVNVYIKFCDPESIQKALVENNTVMDDCHLRVTRCSDTGALHDPRKSVFVGNIPFALEDEALRAKFERCGEIESVRIIRDKTTSVGKGFGYVNFATKDSVELALSLQEEDLTIKNKVLRVKRCTQNTQNNKPKGRFNKQNNQKGGKGQINDAKGQGAFRRIQNKRKSQDMEGPPEKRAHNIDQPAKEKKSRKEFVGMTAEKKKKNKFNKDQKKKKALSEILTK